MTETAPRDRSRLALELAARGALAAQESDARRRAGLAASRLAAVLGAAAEVPVYRDAWRSAGVSSAGIVAPEDLWRLPAVGKADLLGAGVEGRIRPGLDLERLERVETSGSTGPALSIFATPEEALTLAGYFVWPWRRLGIGRDDPALMFAAPYLAAFERPGWVYAAPDAPPSWILDRFRELRPALLVGSTESLALLARDVARAGLETSHVRRLLPFGQTLSDELRAMMAEAFAPPPNDLYGCRETGWVGAACDEGRLHVPDTAVVVQVARVGRPDEPAPHGEPGELILTSLLRTTTPFVRYRIGDVAALDPEPCPCGRDTPCLVGLEGRVQDFLLSTRGELVSPGVVATLVAYGREAVVDHRIVQEDPGRVTVLLVAPEGLAASEEARIGEDLRRHLGQDVEVAVRLVDVIPRDPSGKRRRVHRAFELPEA